MPGFNQQQLSPRVRNANQVIILLGEQPIGFAQTTSHSNDFGTEGLYGVGTSMPQEIQQLRNSPQITLDAFALTEQGLAILGYQSDLYSILANNAFNLCVADQLTGLALYTYVGSVAQNFSESIPANQVVTDAITFLALDVLNASGQSILNVGNAYQFPSNAGVGGGIGLGISVNGPGFSVGGGATF